MLNQIAAIQDVNNTVRRWKYLLNVCSGFLYMYPLQRMDAVMACEVVKAKLALVYGDDTQ